ncbi:hypothetical protein [Paraburkholderia sp. BR14320]|uniref:hypothetical protein n=1 Tax=unclassified Paraburkholderia TaxID=2615204 RepID=UPI0034CFC04E
MPFKVRGKKCKEQLFDGWLKTMPNRHKTGPKEQMEEPLLLSFGDIERAPDAPGLYAWYARIYAPAGDYKRQIDESGTDRGEQRFRELLAKHMLRFQLPSFELRGRGAFGASWRGLMHEKSRDLHQDIFLAKVPSDAPLGEEEKGLEKSLSWIAKDEKRRALLARVLTDLTPLVSAPIYIGVAKNIRSRLRQHVSLYQGLRDAIGTDKEMLEALQDRVAKEGLGFAQRAIACDFSPDHLLVAVCSVRDLAQGDWSDDELRNVAGVAEWLANRWHRPFAGRR